VDASPLAAAGKPLPVHLDFTPQPAPAPPVPSPAAPGKELPRDPFFAPPGGETNPFNFFSDSMDAPGPLPVQPPIIHQRSAMSEYVPQVDSYGTRALVLGLIRLLQRRGILGQDELQRFLNNLAESGELDPTK
jgi:hypothetical protein